MFFPFSCPAAPPELTQNTDVNFISRFQASLDGAADDAPSSAYLKHYVPFVLHSPLLLQTGIATAACLLAETNDASAVAVAYKCRSIGLLNAHLLRAGPAPTDEAVAAVRQMLLNEWCWGSVGDLRAHLSGLREMVRLRGGFAQLGLGGLLARLVIV